MLALTTNTTFAIQWFVACVYCLLGTDFHRRQTITANSEKNSRFDKSQEREKTNELIFRNLFLHVYFTRVRADEKKHLKNNP